MSALWLGRREEAELIESAIERAREGTGGAIFLTGEPGIGKTHLARFASERAKERGLRTAIGRAWEAGGAPPGFPFREALRALRSDPDLEPALAALGPRRAHLGALVPELAEAAETDRFLMFDAVTSLLGELARRRPTLLVLEDLHAADRHTLELLAMVAASTASAPLLLIGTYRSREAQLAPETAEAIARASRSATIVALGPLSPEDALALAAGVWNGSEAELRALIMASEGNPLFVLELARAASARKRSASVAMPGIDHAIAAHLAVLSASAREIAEVAAVLGRTVAPALLTRVAGRDDREAREELARAEVLIADEEGRLVFAHALVRDALYRRLDPGRRSALHAAAVDHLEALGETPSEIAHHALAAAPQIGAERAIALGSRAAESALAAGACADAAALLARVVELADSTEPRLDLTLDLADAQMHAGSVTTARAICLRVAGVTDDPELLARAALIYGYEPTRGHVDPNMVGLLERALGALGDAASPLRVRVLARYAMARFPDPDPEVPVRIAEEAIATARMIGERRVLASAVFWSRLPLFLWYPAPKLVALFDEILEESRAHDNRVELARELMFAALTRLANRDVARFDALIDEALALVEHGPPPQQFRIRLAKAMGAAYRGRFEEAERWRHAAQESARAMSEIPMPAFFLARFGFARLARDRAVIAEAREGISKILALGPNGFAVRAWLSTFFGEIEAARADLPGPEVDLRGRPLAVAAMLAEAAIAANDRALAERLYDLLEPFADDVVFWGLIGFVAEGVAEGWRARLALFLGRPEAERHFARAIELDTACGARPALANLLEDWARATRSPSLAAQASALLTELGLHERAKALGAPAPSSDLLTLSCEGDVYLVALDGEQHRVRGGKGMQFLAQLVAHPGREIHVLELLAIDTESDAGSVLDAKAKERYRARIAELRSELAEAEENADLGRAQRFRSELDALSAELARAIGLGGRDRRAGSTAERARINVQRRLKAAVAAIGAQSKAIEAHLERSLKTGTFCSYDPPAVP